MLSLMDTVQIEDTTIFRDDIDPRKFYLLPDQPVIPVDDEQKLEFLFIKYIKDVDTLADDESIGGGWVQFRTRLVITSERRESILDALRNILTQEKQAGKKPLGNAITSTEPLLASPVWKEGKVSLATFKVSDTGLVRHATEEVDADLSGELGASLGIQLDEIGTEIFWSAFENYKDGQIPIIVNYQLKYLARVTAEMTIHAKRQVLHQKLWQKARPYVLAKANFLRYTPLQFTGVLNASILNNLKQQHGKTVKPFIPKNEVRETIRKSIIDNDIDVTIRSDLVAGEGGESLSQDLMELATELLSERVLPMLFGDGNTTPGASSAAQDNADLELLEIQEMGAGDSEASFDFNLTHESVVEREVNPNGPIQLLVSDASSLQDNFRTLRLTDGFFKLFKVAIQASNVNFERDGLKSIHVFLEYNQIDEQDPTRPLLKRTRDVILTSEKDIKYWTIDLARDVNGMHIKEYRYRTEIAYQEGPIRKTEWRSSNSHVLNISPSVMDAIHVEMALTAPKSVVNEAIVDLKHISDQGTSLTARRTLTHDKSTQSWLQYTGDISGNDHESQIPEYSYKVTYITEHDSIIIPWQKTNEKLLEISNPFDKTLSFVARPLGFTEEINSIDADILYEDDKHDYRFTRHITLDSPSASSEIKIPVLPGAPEDIKWTGKINFSDSSAQDIRGTAQPGTVWVGLSGNFLTVEIIPDLIDFDNDVELATVTLRYQDAANNIDSKKTFIFKKGMANQQTWKVSITDPALKQCSVLIKYIAYDRSKNSEVSLTDHEDPLVLMDRSS